MREAAPRTLRAPGPAAAALTAPRAPAPCAGRARLALGAVCVWSQCEVLFAPAALPCCSLQVDPGLRELGGGH